ncbi:hypothetical protein PLICRDRAFT_46468 [Plicaturopsis crispa FD-325 SS-3]|uniref:F-box domain-containing protein n=1 Tax=Plicaturopsis crispa FD-325 SS-3 TaxID=944288 RepID=A0A0C9SQX1_PLICR|nr:hypothetical protein PLICRDRAFT_46468 [Plicaturopsis crispa FD-325 SS-3]
MAARRSARFKKDSHAKSVPDNADSVPVLEQSASDDDSNSSSRPNKRQKTAVNGHASAKSTARTRKARMKLSNLPEMPLDILYEIFGYLQPLEILHLSWANKALRSILLHRSSVTVWRSALSNYRVDVPDFPETPFDLNEPQFISMMLSDHCHFCTGHAPKTSILWLLRIRCCKNCIRHNLQVITSLEHRRFGIECELMRIDVIHVNGRKKLCHLPDALVNLRAELPKLTTEQQQARRERIARIDRNGHALQRWLEEADRERSSNRKDARIRRQSAIIEKLEAGVWAEEFARMNKDEFYNLSAMKQSTDLTDRSWKQIEPTINKFMEAQRDARLKRERPERTKAAVLILRTLVDEYNLTQPVDTPIVGLADICLMLPFKAVIADTPPDVDITPESFHDAMEQLPRLSAQWLDDATCCLRESLAASSRTGNLALDLAISIFRCKRCRAHPVFTVTEALAHTDPSCGCFNEQSHPDAHFNRAFKACEVLPWMVMYSQRPSEENPEPTLNFVRNALIDGCARDVVAACGQDPEKVTAAEMDALDPWVQCRWCMDNATYEPDRTVGMHWRTAVRLNTSMRNGFVCVEGALTCTIQIEHASSVDGVTKAYREAHEPAGPHMWRLLDENETQLARERRDSRHVRQSRPPLDSTYRRCMRCRYVFGADKMGRHLEYSHGKGSPTDTDSFPVSAVDAAPHIDWRAAIDISLDSKAWYAPKRV